MKTIKIEDALRLEKTIFIDVRTEKEYLEELDILKMVWLEKLKEDKYMDDGR